MTTTVQARYFTDLAERILATFVVTFIAQLIASGWFDVDHVTDIGIAEKAALAGLAAVLSLVKGLAAKYVGSPNTAALLPANSETPDP